MCRSNRTNKYWATAAKHVQNALGKKHFVDVVIFAIQADLVIIIVNLIDECVFACQFRVLYFSSSLTVFFIMLMVCVHTYTKYSTTHRQLLRTHMGTHSFSHARSLSHSYKHALAESTHSK